MSDVRVIHGDCLEILPTLSGVDAVVTDPPYHLTSIVKRFGGENAAPAKHGTDGAFARASAGFMGKQWDGGDIAFRPETWRLVYEAMKPGAHLAAFGGSRTFHRMACAIEDAGFELRDTLMWIYGSGFPKSHDVSKGIDKAVGAERRVIGRAIYGDGHVQNSGKSIGYGGSDPAADQRNLTAPATPEAARWAGWGTALKPAFEPIILARKPLVGTVAANVLAHGTGAINIDGCRVEAPDGLASGGVNRHAGTGWGFGDIRSQPHALGRWPANVLHDGSDEVVAGFPATAPSSDRPRNNGEFKSVAKGADSAHITFGHVDAGGSAARFFYCAKASKKDRADSKHPTVKPILLIRWLTRLITPPGGTVLDCFAGSGTTGEAARLEGFNAILIEREDEYVADIRRRLAAPSPSRLPLFADAPLFAEQTDLEDFLA